MVIPEQGHGDTSLSGNKRPREEEISEGKSEASPEDFETFTDTLIALRIMCAQFPKIEKVAVQPFVLRSQLYSSVKDRTQVDRELEASRKEGILRIFKLNTGQDDHAIMFMDDYLKQVEAAKKRMEAKHPDEIVVFEWFVASVLASNLEVAISHAELCGLLSDGGEVRDKHISVLINAGLLGRKELLSFLNRRKYKEILLPLLEKRRLRFSQLDIRFHIRDLIGSGHLKTIQTPAGLLVRVAKY